MRLWVRVPFEILTIKCIFPSIKFNTFLTFTSTEILLNNKIPEIQSIYNIFNRAPFINSEEESIEQKLELENNYKNLYEKYKNTAELSLLNNFYKEFDDLKKEEDKKNRSRERYLYSINMFKKINFVLLVGAFIIYIFYISEKIYLFVKENDINIFFFIFLDLFILILNIIHRFSFQEFAKLLEDNTRAKYLYTLIILIILNIGEILISMLLFNDDYQDNQSLWIIKLFLNIFLGVLLSVFSLMYASEELIIIDNYKLYFPELIRLELNEELIN